MFAAYFLIRDYTNAIAYGRYAIERERGKTVSEGKICIKQAAMFQSSI